MPGSTSSVSIYLLSQLFPLCVSLFLPGPQATYKGNDLSTTIASGAFLSLATWTRPGRDCPYGPFIPEHVTFLKESTPFSAGFSAASTNISLWRPLFHIQPQPLNCLGEHAAALCQLNHVGFTKHLCICNMLVPASAAVALQGWCNFGFAPHTNTGWGFYTFPLREQRSQVPRGEYFSPKDRNGMKSCCMQAQSLFYSYCTLSIGQGHQEMQSRTPPR